MKPVDSRCFTLPTGECVSPVECMHGPPNPESVAKLLGEPLVRTDGVLVPCSMQPCSDSAVGIWKMPRGCFALPDIRLQALCPQHENKATPLGDMILITRLVQQIPLPNGDYHVHGPDQNCDVECMQEYYRAKDGVLIHFAGQPDGLVQKCSLCGKVLLSYEGRMSTGTWNPHWWKGNVMVSKNSSAGTDEPPDCVRT